MASSSRLILLRARTRMDPARGAEAGRARGRAELHRHRRPLFLVRLRLLRPLSPVKPRRRLLLCLVSLVNTRRRRRLQYPAKSPLYHPLSPDKLHHRLPPSRVKNRHHRLLPSRAKHLHHRPLCPDKHLHLHLRFPVKLPLHRRQYPDKHLLPRPLFPDKLRHRLLPSRARLPLRHQDSLAESLPLQFQARLLLLPRSNHEPAGELAACSALVVRAGTELSVMMNTVKNQDDYDIGILGF